MSFDFISLQLGVMAAAMAKFRLEYESDQMGPYKMKAGFCQSSFDSNNCWLSC